MGGTTAATTAKSTKQAQEMTMTMSKKKKEKKKRRHDEQAYQPSFVGYLQAASTFNKRKHV